MTSPYNDAGQQDLREYITANWTQLALIDETDTIEAVLDITSDSRASWTDPATNPIEARATVNGGDSDIDAPVEIAGTALFTGDATVSAGDALADVSPTHDGAFGNLDGTLLVSSGQDSTFVHEIQQPQL